MAARRLAWHFSALTAVTWVLLGFGAAVRANGAGLACPDWPLCFGEVVPTMNLKVGLEWGHRAVAGVVSLGFLAGLAGLARDAGARRAAGWLPLVAAGLLVAQIALGALTVLHLLAPWTVGSHLIVGNLFCATLFVIAARLHVEASPARGPLAPSSLGARVHWAAAGALLLVQLRVGGMVSSHYAGMACDEWPMCRGGEFAPSFEGLVGMHVVHRLIAYALIAVYFTLWLRGGAAARLSFRLVLLQAGLGIANVLLEIPPEVTVAHTYLAAALLLATTWGAWDAFRRPSLSQTPQPGYAGGSADAEVAA